MAESVKVVVPWHNRQQCDLFLEAWRLREDDARLLLVRDVNHDGCARTKNCGVGMAVEAGADVVIVLDDDCYPSSETQDLNALIAGHLASLVDADMELCVPVTTPQSRGTPYNRPARATVAASMGFWEGVGDYDALGQLVHGATHPMRFLKKHIYGQYFPLCGMNLAFRPKEWFPWCQFIDVPRFDDIWMGWLWQKEAYRRGCCFSLNGPTVKHARQSNVWANLRDEAKYLEANETLWLKIHQSKEWDYEKLKSLCPR